MHSGRDFFKLPRIELRCEVSPGHLEVVEPHVDAAAPLVDESDRPSPAPVTLVEQPASVMEVDSRPPSHASHAPPHPPLGPPHQSHPNRHEPHHHQSQPLQQVEANRQSLPPPVQSPRGANPHGPPQKSPSNPLPSPSVKPVHDVQFAQPQSRENTVGLANRTRDLPPVMAHSHSPAEHHRPNGQYYPRAPSDVSLDAIERLQTQISQNSGAVSVHSRDLNQLRETAAHVEDGLRRDFQTQIHQQNSDIGRVDEAVGRLQLEMRDIRQLLEVLTRDVQTLGSRSIAVAAPPTVTAQDSALELMTQQITNITHKANEVDTLKITIEIMKNKIQRLEDVAFPNSNQQPPAHAAPSPHERSTQPIQTIASYHATPVAVPHISTPVHPANRQASFHSHGSHSAATPEMSQRPESTPTQSGWVTVNSSVKRAHPNGIEHEHHGQAVESPKRPKLAPIEPRAGYAGAQPPQQVYEHMDTDDSDSRVPTLAHTLPSQPQAQAPTQAHHSHESLAEVSLAQPTLASQQVQHPIYATYHTQDAPPDDSWRPESQRITEHRTPRGRGRGGGPGSRGGRGRKSMPIQVHLGTPEWERDDWQGVAESQTSPDGYYNHVPRSGRGIVRRGSGGSTRGRPSSSSGRAVSLGMQGVTTGLAIGLPGDPYAHTKKTRSKPIRNADGILIRKDGRPDMRSQSSAANLRKVHARKDELKDDEREFTPSSSVQPRTSSMGPETPSPTSHLPPEHQQHHVTNSVQKKHNFIMGKMFPGGVDESRREHDLSRKVFDEGQAHEAQPKFQAHNHHHHHQQHGHAPVERPGPQIKREHLEERRILASQSPNDGDTYMDRGEDHADDESQTPSDRSENYHDVANHREEQRVPQQQPQAQSQPQLSESTTTQASSNTVQAVPPSTTNTTQTLEATPTAQSTSA